MRILIGVADFGDKVEKNDWNKTEVWLSRTPTKLRGCRHMLRTVEVGLEGMYCNALVRAQLTAVWNDRVHVITVYAGRPISVWITEGDFAYKWE